MKKQQRIVLLWIGLIILIVSFGKFSGSISFEKKEAIEKPFVIENFSWIEDITWILYISPGSLEQILFLFKKAKYNISLQTYEFTEKRFKSLFNQLLQENVDIRIIMENRKYQQFKNTFKDIQNYFSWYDNFQIQSDDKMKTTYVHSKFALIDSGFLIQTSNLTHSAFFINREYFFYSQHNWVYQSLATIFEKDRNWQAIKNSDIHPNLLVCPINCRSVLEYMISSAEKSIIIQNQYVEDPRLLWLLEDKIKVLWSWNVQIQLPETDKNKLLQQKRWKSIVKLIKKPYIHAKMMLIDKQILYLWSINFSANSMDNNRELWILIKDESIIKKFRDNLY